MRVARARNPVLGKPHILMGGVALVYVSACWETGNASSKISEYVI